MGGDGAQDPAGQEDEVGVEQEERDAPEAIAAMIYRSEWEVVTQEKRFVTLTSFEMCGLRAISR